MAGDGGGRGDEEGESKREHDEVSNSTEEKLPNIRSTFSDAFPFRRRTQKVGNFFGNLTVFLGTYHKCKLNKIIRQFCVSLELKLTVSNGIFK